LRGRLLRDPTNVLPSIRSSLMLSGHRFSCSYRRCAKDRAFHEPEDGHAPTTTSHARRLTTARACPQDPTVLCRSGPAAGTTRPTPCRPAQGSGAAAILLVPAA